MPPGVIRPSFPVPYSANQTFPSGPDTTKLGRLGANNGNEVIAPWTLTRQILSYWSVTQRFPSEPATIWVGPTASLPTVGTGNSVNMPSAERRPTILVLNSVN